MGAIVLTTGVVYFLLLGHRLLPERTPPGALAESYAIQDYISEIRVHEKSPLVDQNLADTNLGAEYGLNVLRIRRATGDTVPPGPDRRVRPGDVLIVEGTPNGIFAASEALGLEKISEWKFEDEEPESPLEELRLVEVTLSPRSGLQGKTLKDIDFRARYGLTVLAIRHHGREIVSNLSDVPLDFGDALLIEGPQPRINQLRQENDFLVLEAPPIEIRKTRKAPLAVLILLGVLAVVSLRILHVSTAMLIGGVLMILTGVLSMDEAYQSIEWKSVFLIAGMLPMGIAMQNTQTALFLAQQITNAVGNFGSLAVLMGVFLMTALLTEAMSNAAATVLVTPIAIDAARTLGANPQAFVMAVVIAAATSFLMPIGHQANVLVFGPGGYRFFDYTRVGVWLNILIFIIVALTLPLIWPL